MGSQSFDADVIIAGGGPCGLVLAHELGRRNIRTILFNDRPETSPHPQANATPSAHHGTLSPLGIRQARTCRRSTI